MKRKNGFLIALIVLAIILFGIIASVVIRSTRTVNAVVPNQTITAGTTIDASMLDSIQVPVGVPNGYIIDKSTLVGQRLKINAQPGQLMYISDVVVNWSDVVYGVDVPEDYIVTAIQLPDNRAVGGLITAGDTVDILGVSVEKENNYNGSNNYIVDPVSGESFYLDPMYDKIGAVASNGYGASGSRSYWVLANVKILETNASLSEADNTLLTQITNNNSGSSGGAYYIVALSRNDYQKLLICNKYLDIWMSIAPSWNQRNEPILEFMQYSKMSGLTDAQAQSLIESYEDEIGSIQYRLTEEGEAELAKLRSEYKTYKERFERAQMSSFGYVKYEVPELFITDLDKNDDKEVKDKVNENSYVEMTKENNSSTIGEDAPTIIEETEEDIDSSINGTDAPTPVEESGNEVIENESKNN